MERLEQVDVKSVGDFFFVFLNEGNNSNSFQLNVKTLLEYNFEWIILLYLVLVELFVRFNVGSRVFYNKTFMKRCEIVVRFF